MALVEHPPELRFGYAVAVEMWHNPSCSKCVAPETMAEVLGLAAPGPASAAR